MSERGVEERERRDVRWRWRWLEATRPRRLLLLLGCLLALVAIWWLGLAAVQPGTPDYDLTVSRTIQALRSAPLQEVMRWISLPGYEPWNLIVVGVGTLLVGWRFEWRTGAFLLALTGGQGLTNHLLKTAVGRPRPTDDLVDVFVASPGNSFPSGHVMFYTVFFGFLLFLFWSRLAQSWRRALLVLGALAMMLLVGPSRLYLGAHWLSDVIAAHLIGLMFLLPAIELYIARVAPSAPGVAARAVEPERTQASSL